MSVWLEAVNPQGASKLAGNGGEELEKNREGKADSIEEMLFWKWVKLERMGNSLLEIGPSPILDIYSPWQEIFFVFLIKIQKRQGGKTFGHPAHGPF